MGLTGVTQDRQAGVLRGQGDAGEVDVRGDVFQADFVQRVDVGLVQMVAHQRAHVPLRVVVLGFGKSIVQQEGGAAAPGLQALGQAGDKGLGLRVDFGQIVVLARDLQRRAQVGGAVRPGQIFRFSDHAALVPDTTLAHQQPYRHRIQHLVAHHHPLQGLRPGIQPTDLVSMRGQGLRLACAQTAREIDDGVATHRVAQGVEQLQGERTGAGTEFEHLVSASLRQRLPHLHRQGLAKKRRQTGRGHKVAARIRHGAEFLQGIGVVAQTGLIQRHGHEAIKRQPAAGLGNAGVQPLHQTGLEFGRVGGGDVRLESHWAIVAHGVAHGVWLQRLPAARLKPRRKAQGKSPSGIIHHLAQPVFPAGTGSHLWNAPP